MALPGYPMLRHGVRTVTYGFGSGDPNTLMQDRSPRVGQLTGPKHPASPARFPRQVMLHCSVTPVPPGTTGNCASSTTVENCPPQLAEVAPEAVHSLSTTSGLPEGLNHTRICAPPDPDAAVAIPLMSTGIPPVTNVHATVPVVP